MDPKADRPAGTKARRERAQVGIRDVAREAGVSVASVSRALSKPETVSAAMRHKIQRATERLHYVPNAAARSLSLQRSHTIGAVVPTLEFSIFARFIEALQSRALEGGYSLVVSTCGFDQDRELAQARTLIGHGVEALIVSGAQHRPELYDLLDSRGIPYAHTSVYTPGSRHPCIGYDNRGAAMQAAAHLLSLGHREIGALVGPRASNDRMVLRIEGMRAALGRDGLSLPESRIAECSFSIAKARETFRGLMAREPGLTALLCGNDVLAFGVLLEAQAMGIRVPEDLSVVGFDNLEWAAEITPRLTTIRVPTHDMGAATADYLMARLKGGAVSHHTKIEVDLILRDSTGPRPDR